MTATLTRPAWTTDLELEIFNKLLDDLPILYDTWRREVLSYFLDIPVAKLPKLVSVND